MSNNSSGERTERATPKKRRDAREKGQVLKSTEVNTAVSLVCMFGALRLLSPYIGQRAYSLMTRYLSGEFVLTLEEVSASSLWPLVSNVLFDAMMILLPLLGVALLTGLAANLVQVGFLFAPKTLQPKFSRINPLQGLKRLFSMRSLVELVKSVAKVAILGKIVYDEYMNNLGLLPAMMYSDILTSIGRVISSIINIGLKAGMVLLILALMDFLYQWWRHEKDLKMTKQEVKDEYKMMEGDPQIKNRIRQKQRQMGMMRMMSAVPEADVVITNPTHYAVAIKYKEEDMAAPEVVAKGKDLVAQRIREVAGEHGVLIVENRPVAQGLFFYCEVGDMVPPAMYQAVAEILAMVYRARRSA